MQFGNRPQFDGTHWGVRGTLNVMLFVFTSAGTDRTDGEPYCCRDREDAKNGLVSGGNWIQGWLQYSTENDRQHDEHQLMGDSHVADLAESFQQKSNRVKYPYILYKTCRQIIKPHKTDWSWLERPEVRIIDC